MCPPYFHLKWGEHTQNTLNNMHFRDNEAKRREPGIRESWTRTGPLSLRGLTKVTWPHWQDSPETRPQWKVSYNETIKQDICIVSLRSSWQNLSSMKNHCQFQHGASLFLSGLQGWINFEWRPPPQPRVVTQAHLEGIFFFSKKSTAHNLSMDDSVF